ncbi:MAG: ATP-binding protein [Elainellaceae cyanobacterium]
MIRSFRLRIALLVTAVAGVALMGFSGAAWRLIYAAKVGRVDARLETQFRRLGRGFPPPEFWRSGAVDLLRQSRREAVALQVLDPQGNVIYESENWSPAFSPRYPPPLGENRDRRRLKRSDQRGDRLQTERATPGGEPPRPRIITRRTPSGTWRVSAASTPSGRVAIAVSLQTLNQEMATIRTIFLVAVPATLLIVAAGAWVLSGSALRPVRRLTGAMQQITVAGLDRRVPVGTTDVEFAALIQVFNQMLERLERSFRQASRFSADAAHELKTPLAILQGELEQALQQAAPGSKPQQQLGSLLDEVRRLSGIVRKLLLLSLADAGQMGLHKTQIDLSALLATMVEDLELLAPHLSVEARIAPDLYVCGDRDLLAQVLQNLTSNAVKYNLAEGWVRLEAVRLSVVHRHDQVQVTMTNASRNIPEGDRDRIFDRFYRGDPSRNRSVEGLGLGLSLSREIAAAHGGSLTLAAVKEGQTTFVLALPASQPTASVLMR